MDPEHRARHAALRTFCRLLLPSIVLAWLLLGWLTWRTVLERRRGDPNDPLIAIGLPVAVDDLLNAPALREALKRLHQPVSVATRRLDAAPTAIRTVRHAGLFQPVTRRRRAVPELVVLVETRHAGDQMAGLAGQLVARLGEAGLQVRRYDYRDSPHRAVGADGRWRPIADLLARHAGARLLLIGEPAALLDPASGRLLDWTRALAAAPQRGLLATRRPPADWERALTGAGFMVAEISSAGLETLAWHLTGLGIPAGSALPATMQPLPRLLQDGRRWSQPVAPAPAERAALLDALDGFLGPDGVRLLTVMAAYPQLHWGLTRVLDLHLFGPAVGHWTDREGRLLRIARLPWCRLGWLPDWLRAAPLERLPPEEQRAIRDLYRALLREATTAPGAPGELAVALPVSLPRAANLAAGLWDWVRHRGWRLGRWLRGLRTLSDEHGVLRDAIFADILFGWRPRLLDFIAPRRLLRRYWVTLRPFAIGRTEVSFADYDRFAEATGRAKPGDEGWGRGDRPVINVSWADATAYAAWLSTQTGRPYRLPSEAEWEYAARAGAQTPFWSGDCIDTDQANYDGIDPPSRCWSKTAVYPAVYRGKTVPVGSLAPNPWGLYEVAGNVWEWVQDAWHANYQGAPDDGRAWEGASGVSRVLRGGGWIGNARDLRCAYRILLDPGFRLQNAGFRLVLGPQPRPEAAGR